MMETDKGRQIRLKYLYRKMVISGKAQIPYAAAVKLVGPDCAYHLYSTVNLKTQETEKKE
ncbi:MAG: hypothetical protein SFH39_01295 [Candidatus Magnetobacterium sp. LHC-1]|nr:hypothetical protein [Nitrospirota bacterium]